jgi:hypothetical protein
MIKRLALGAVAFALAFTVVVPTSPAEARETSWGCPTC